MLKCGCPGGHVRHCIEFYQCFLDQWPSGHVNYDARARDPEIEADPAAAVRSLHELSRCFEESDGSSLHDHPLKVREGGTDWLDSTSGRERRFLFSHTVHHMALIAILLRSHGTTVPEEFGVAPSTMAYRRTLVPKTISVPCAR
jgi:hypothetical protein